MDCVQCVFCSSGERENPQFHLVFLSFASWLLANLEAICFSLAHPLNHRGTVAVPHLIRRMLRICLSVLPLEGRSREKLARVHSCYFIFLKVNAFPPGFLSLNLLIKFLLLHVLPTILLVSSWGKSSHHLRTSRKLRICVKNLKWWIGHVHCDIRPSLNPQQTCLFVASLSE